MPKFITYQRPAPVSNMVGNPRRLRKLEPAAFLAA